MSNERERPQAYVTPPAPETSPPAGPHAKPELTDDERTPGAGALPDADSDETGDSASS